MSIATDEVNVSVEYNARTDDSARRLLQRITKLAEPLSNDPPQGRLVESQEERIGATERVTFLPKAIDEYLTKRSLSARERARAIPQPIPLRSWLLFQLFDISSPNKYVWSPPPDAIRSMFRGPYYPDETSVIEPSADRFQIMADLVHMPSLVRRDIKVAGTSKATLARLTQHCDAIEAWLADLSSFALSGNNEPSVQYSEIMTWVDNLKHGSNEIQEMHPERVSYVQIQALRSDIRDLIGAVEDCEELPRETIDFVLRNLHRIDEALIRVAAKGPEVVRAAVQTLIGDATITVVSPASTDQSGVLQRFYGVVAVAATVATLVGVPIQIAADLTDLRHALAAPTAVATPSITAPPEPRSLPGSDASRSQPAHDDSGLR